MNYWEKKKKKKGEFHPSGTNDVLTAALETPDHSGRVRAVGGFITPKAFFNLPRAKSSPITKAELLARDKQSSKELEKATSELRSEIAALKALIKDSQSNLISDGGSFNPGKVKGVDEDNLVKPSFPPD